jgi:hypothetical protein
MNSRSCVTTSSRLGKTLVAALFAFGALAAVPGTPAQAHESEHESVSVETRAQPAKVKAGAKCNKKGKKRGKFTCKRSKGKLVWVRKGEKTAQQAVVLDALCSTSTYTSQVRGLRCSSTTITFGSKGLPSAGTPMMVGITATNQQYPRTHNYTLGFPRVAQASSTTVSPGAGPIGVAVDGVPLFSPWTQAALREHAFDMGELDNCGGHAGRGDDYHYHIAPKCLIEELGKTHVDDKKLPIGIANDANPILALGWFDKANDVESRLDSCRAMKDKSGKYFYNVQHQSKWDILNCFVSRVQKTSRDSWTQRRDSTGAEIVGAKVAMTITASSTVRASGTQCSVMQGTLRDQSVINTDQSVTKSSANTAIFYCQPQCYAEFFEPTGRFPGRSVYYELVTSRCPAGFNPNSLPLFAPYQGPALGKRAAK